MDNPSESDEKLRKENDVVTWSRGCTSQSDQAQVKSWWRGKKARGFENPESFQTLYIYKRSELAQVNKAKTNGYR